MDYFYVVVNINFEKEFKGRLILEYSFNIS